VLTCPEPSRDALLRSLVRWPGSEPLAPLIAIAEADTIPMGSTPTGLGTFADPRPRQ
jgi:hypothetical protein